jgi:hypothetical protein
MTTYLEQLNIRKINITLFAVLGVLFVGYVYLLGNTIFDVVARKEIETNNRTAMSEISSLELGNLSMYNNLDITYAKSIGFVESTPHFATRAAFVVR